MLSRPKYYLKPALAALALPDSMEGEESAPAEATQPVTMVSPASPVGVETFPVEDAVSSTDTSK